MFEKWRLGDLEEESWEGCLRRMLRRISEGGGGGTVDLQVLLRRMVGYVVSCCLCLCLFIFLSTYRVDGYEIEGVIWLSTDYSAHRCFAKITLYIRRNEIQPRRRCLPQSRSIRGRFQYRDSNHLEDESFLVVLMRRCDHLLSISEERINEHYAIQSLDSNLMLTNESMRHCGKKDS